MLASTFRPHRSTATRSREPLSDDAIRAVAPSIFASEAHASRSARYAYIPTSAVLQGLRNEGFQPFEICQTRVRDVSKAEHTKHMIRLRHASQIAVSEANEIILLNSHDGTSSYQMLAGVFRFVCQNGLVVGDTVGDVRIRHQGAAVDDVIEGAYTVLKDFKRVDEQREAMQAVQLTGGQQTALATAALTLRYDEGAAPIEPAQLLRPRRWDDNGADLWSTFNRVQESLIRGGVRGRNSLGRVAKTRAVTGIDQSVKLNRALWVLADEMRKLAA